jgi:hypothetical protein
MGDNDFTESEEVALRRHLRELSEKVAAYEAGAEEYSPSDTEGQQLPAAQLWHMLLNVSREKRFRVLHQIQQTQEEASNCFLNNHRSLEQENADLRMKLQGLQERVDSLNTALTHKMGEIAAYQKVLEIQAGPRVEYAAVASPTLDDLPEFQGDRGVREKIGDQLKSAGIDLHSLCRYEWWTDDEHEHICGQVNPLHAEAHVCELATCRATLSHEDAERLINNG